MLTGSLKWYEGWYGLTGYKRRIKTTNYHINRLEKEIKNTETYINFLVIISHLNHRYRIKKEYYSKRKRIRVLTIKLKEQEKNLQFLIDGVKYMETKGR